MMTPKILRERIFNQHVGTGLLIYKSGPKEICQVEVFINRRTQQLCYIRNGQPVEFHLTEEQEDTA